MNALFTQEGWRPGIVFNIANLASLGLNPDVIAALQQLPSAPARSDDDFYQALLHLDFARQEDSFRSFVTKSKAGAFLIHGEGDEYGQRWLLNRLVQRCVRGSTLAKRIPINVSSKVAGGNIDDLWRELGGRVGLLNPSSRREIAQCVCNAWQTQHTLLILDQVEDMPPEWVEALLQDFWLPLVEQALDMLKQPTSFWLLMFLIGYNSRVEDWSATFADSETQAWEPRMPVKLPCLCRFTAEDLAEWRRVMSWYLPPELTVEDILSNSGDGVPQRALVYVCSRCNYDWYDKESLWLRY